jgi:hypothetical protein
MKIAIIDFHLLSPMPQKHTPHKMKVGLEIYEEFFMLISLTRNHFHFVAGFGYRSWHHAARTLTPLLAR